MSRPAVFTSLSGRGRQETPLTRDAIVAAARRWIGTPYCHQGALRGVGCDCLGLVRGLYGELAGRPAAAPPPYSPDWAEARRRDTLIEAAREHLVEIPTESAAAGDVVVFRLFRGAVAKHAAVLAGGGRMIHAYSGHGVVEVALAPWWARRVAAAFRFPGLQEAEGSAAATGTGDREARSGAAATGTWDQEAPSGAAATGTE